MTRLGWCLVLAACGSSASAPAPPTPAPAPASPPPAMADPEAAERARRDELAAAHRVLEEEQQEALATTCDRQAPRATAPRCLPSCYATELADRRAGAKLARRIELAATVCKATGDDGAERFVIVPELTVAKRAPRRVRGRFPRAHKQQTWQGAVEAALAAGPPALPRGDVIRVVGKWRARVHPVTKERLRCVDVAHYTAPKRRTLDACGGGDGALACEAMGNAAARGINVVHYRLAEARRLQAAGKADACQQAALEAVAVARGLPRWRQYMKINVATWTDHAGYRTRFDGILDEDTLFATAARLGRDAEAVYVACGGPGGAPTKVAQEQSFHTCW